ncbi:glutathione S-transferase (plasmid) [Microvirga ossetica]|uniref:Glutathione S-transferase n=1 Tax=Microvirga ossetica TaxID=1882682 RepID=A0A1B2ES49_9HYPH|nr:glutathione S-transferase family protein [Microvirga ossetica]ANY82652.1 glutathione S-transferase [Microvirga ossetica]
MITITAMKWAPPFAAGSVRDHRARWILNEVGWPYRVRLVDAPTMSSAQYRTQQPFGQVPVMEEDGRPALFESGAIVLDVATRSGRLLPADANQRSEAVMWVIAALNSIEPFLMNLAEVEFFIPDETEKRLRRPAVLAAAKKRLGELQDALGGRQWLVGDSFTVGDLMMSSVLKIASSLEVLEGFPALAAYQARCFDRPAYRKAIDDQCATIAQHRMEDMRYEEAHHG